MIKPCSLYRQHNDVVGGPKFYLVLKTNYQKDEHGFNNQELTCLTEQGKIVLLHGDYNIRYFYDQIA